jgi:general secretion pathway protein I
MNRPRRQAGFTLIEVVVAFVMLALVLAVSFEIFSTGMARAADLEERSQALAIAQSRLSMAGAEEALAEGDTSGESEDHRYRWILSVRRFDEAADAGKPQPSVAYQLFRVESRVEWRGGDSRDHSLMLATLAMGTRTQ